MSNLTRYGQTALDKTFPDADESVFGHMVLELGMSPDEATQNLRPWVRDLDRSAELSKKTAYMAAFIGAGAGLATAATMGIGLTAILPIAAAAYNFFAGQQSAREQGVRESEYLLLKTCPELLKLIYALTQKGMPKEALVECYDDLLGAFTMQFQQRASLGLSDELDHDIVRSFQEIVKQKCEAESLARAIVAETENFTFDTLYQSTEPKTESLPAVADLGSVATSSPIGTATKFGAVQVPSSPAAQADWQTPKIQSTVTPIVLSKLREVCDRNNSFYVAGSKGSGKGIFASNLLRWKLDQYPNALALVLDPKGDVKESGYWRHERIRHFAFKGIALSSEDYAEKVIEFLAEARHLVSQADVTRGMRLFLVLDELLTIKESISNALFAEFRRFGVSAISTGDSEGIHLIAITQSFNAGDSFGSDELLKNFTQVGLFRQDEYTRAKKLIQFGRSNGELTESEFKALIAQSSVGRVMALAGEFIPTPKAENYSAFDRDSGKVIQQMPLGSNPTEGDILANELSRKIQTMSVATPAESDEADDDELAIRAEVKRFLLANADGSKPRDLSARGRKPVKGMATEDIKFVLDLMALEEEIYEVDGTYFANRS